MSEKFPKATPEAYDDEGRIKDPEIARRMANIEAPFREKKLGFFSPSRKKIEEGTLRAEDELDKIIRENVDNDAADATITALLPQFREMCVAVSESMPDYAHFRLNKWQKIEGWIEDKKNFTNRPAILSQLLDEIAMHQESEDMTQVNNAN